MDALDLDGHARDAADAADVADAAADARIEAALAQRRDPPGPVRIVAILVAVVVLGTTAIVALFGGAGADVPIVGKVAPPIVGSTLAGARVEMAAARGRWELVSFFAPWCPQCVQEQPELARFVDRHRVDRTAGVVSIVVDTTHGETEAFVQRWRPTWPFVVDPDGGTSVAWGEAKVPESYLVSPDSIVVAKFTGALTADQVDGTIHRLEQEAARRASHS